MYVAQKGRGRGVAKALLAAVEAEAARRGYDALRLHSAKAMQGAIALYRAAGYRDRARFWKYPDSDINLYMEKALPMREDVVTDGGDASRVKNAPKAEDGFVVPKVVE